VDYEKRRDRVAQKVEVAVARALAELYRGGEGMEITVSSQFGGFGLRRDHFPTYSSVGECESSTRRIVVKCT
jgi:hypothetical protein